MKATTGWIVAARNSARLAGGLEGMGRYPTAKVEMYTAPERDKQWRVSVIYRQLQRVLDLPIPIGPK